MCSLTIEREDLRPEVAARVIADGALADAIRALRSTFLELRERYRLVIDPGPRGYAAQAIQVEIEGDERLLRADAVDIVQRFLTALGV